MLAGESRNPLVTEARDRLRHARDTLRRTAGHWGAAGSHLDEYVIGVLGLVPLGSAAPAGPPVDPTTVDRATPPDWPDEPTRISTQKQARHVLGTREYASRKNGPKGESAFFDVESAHRLSREAWDRGQPIDKDRTYVREHDFGYPVGVDGCGRYQNRVRSHLDHKGRLHGHPCGPGTSRRPEDLT
ncbi:hypothetical protein AHOG_09290 [Actinoalloteichus hoggarensis]|uniref:Uncharacterized protein n=1 Tax=Actinoalloteichus hoggarensis TaxID=1470176 RepID=A0A221W161_9PSEU|nr:hypothetical protein AHOG_09290 [Actinoalloteichus hoggarensis]